MDATKIGTVGHTIATGSGKYFDYKDPKPSQLDIKDIAQSLSNICRFNGHCSFYSVAEHSVHCATLAIKTGLPDQDIYAVLMHDAQEAYTGDMCKPLKNIMPEYAELEDRIEKVVQKHFKINNDRPALVKTFDLQMLKAEKAHLFPKDKENWFAFEDVAEVSITIGCWNPDEAAIRFLQLYYKYRPTPSRCKFDKCDNTSVCKKLGMCRYKYHKDVING